MRVALLCFLVGCGGGSSGTIDSGPAGGDGGGGPPDAAWEIIEPEDPGPADVRFDVDTTADRHPISPFIYGSNQPDGQLDKVTLIRLGGNRWSAYNWETNASNAGEDWFNQNDGYLSDSDTPGEAIRPRVEAARNAGAGAIVTVPMTGHVAADKNGDGDVGSSGLDYLDERFHESVARKGAAFADPPDTSDDVVYQDELVAWMESELPADAARPIMYSLDNEPDLWSSTHPRIHPEPVRYDELLAKTLAYSAAIKDVAPDALVLGPASYGWNGYVTLQDAPDADEHGEFLDFYLAELAAAEASQGRRLVDVLDLHWYPEAQGGGQRITVDDAAPDVAWARMQAPRSLWDETYTEDSWIAMWSTSGPIRLIPRIKDKIDALYPGTKLGFTEYWYGGGGDISGAIAQADVLGIFGREDVFLATAWHLSDQVAFVYAAFAMYREAGGGFGDTSTRASTDDVERTSVYASTRDGAVVLVVINKADTALTTAIPVRHFAGVTTADVFQLTSAAPEPVPAAQLSATARNAFIYIMPARSVSTLVLRP